LGIHLSSVSARELSDLERTTSKKIVTAPAFNKEDELHWLALRLIPGLGTRKAAQMLTQFRTPQAIFRASRSDLESSG
jgi:ERCC4-type nuclease